MKRGWRTGRLRTPGLYLLGGLVVTVLVAEACALWEPVHPRFEAYRYSPPHDTEWQPTPLGWFAPYAPPDPDPHPRFVRLQAAADPAWLGKYLDPGALGRSECVRTDRGLGLEIESLDLDYSAFDVDRGNVLAVRSGWPWACVAAQRWELMKAWSPTRPNYWATALSAQAMLHALPRRYNVPGVFLYGPLWPGLILDTVFFAGCLWVAAFGRGVFVRKLRQRAGRCPGCAYDLAGLPQGGACPECGKAAAPTAAQGVRIVEIRLLPGNGAGR